MRTPMKTLRTLLIFICLPLFAVTGLSQSAKFDIMTYTAPAGWAVDSDANSLRFSKESGGNYCVISLLRSMDGLGDSRKDFDLLWKGMATEELNAKEVQRGQGGDKDGWKAELGIAPFEKDGLKGAAFLTTFTGNGKVIAILAIANATEFQADIETFVNNVKLPPITAQKTPLPAQKAPVPPSGDAAKLIGRWQRSSSGHPSYADAASWGTAGYTTGRYEFKPDGTYIYTERTFRMTHPNVFVVRENGRYLASGNT